jgi:type IV pilus assembly protein PilW
MLIRNNKASGFTLVELMVGMLLSLLIVGGLLYINEQQKEAATFQATSTRFTQHMRDLMERMSSDIRRAGYLGYRHFVSTSTVSFDNPFASSNLSGVNTDISIAEQTGEAANSCITFTYNLDDDYPALVGAGTLAIGVGFDIDNLEMFGYRLDDGGLFMRTGANASANFDCDDGVWTPMSDAEQATITGLTFSLASTGCDNVTNAARLDCFGTATPSDASDDPVTGDTIVVVREVSIRLAGQSVIEPELTTTLEQTVNIANDRVYTQP